MRIYFRVPAPFSRSVGPPHFNAQSIMKRNCDGVSRPTFTRHGHSLGRAVSRPSTPSTTFRELRRAVFNGTHDHFSFRKVVGRHGAIMTELGQLLHSSSPPSQASLYTVYQKLAKLNAMWIRLICVPDDSVYGGTHEEDKYRETVSGMIDLFTGRLLGMLTDKDGEPNRHPPFDELMDAQSRFFCMLSAAGRGDAHFTETRNQLCTYVSCLRRAWDTLEARGANNDAHYVTSSDCIAAAMSLGSWLDTIIK